MSNNAMKSESTTVKESSGKTTDQMEKNPANKEASGSECCPNFDPERWDRKSFEWNDRPFIKESMPTFLHMPFPPIIWWKITKMCKMAENAKANLAKKEDTLLLFYDPHPFKSEIYLSVSGEVPKAKNIKITEKLMSRVFDGPYNDIPQYIKEMNKYLATENKTAKRYYIHYAYCPKCIKKYGHNYMILFAGI